MHGETGHPIRRTYGLEIFASWPPPRRPTSDWMRHVDLSLPGERRTHATASRIFAGVTMYDLVGRSGRYAEVIPCTGAQSRTTEATS
jgi:hypothetical protein